MLPNIPFTQAYWTKNVQSTLRNYCITHIRKCMSDAMLITYDMFEQDIFPEILQQRLAGKIYVKTHPPGSSLNAIQMAFNGLIHPMSA
jgi:hypothetical protein